MKNISYLTTAIAVVSLQLLAACGETPLERPDEKFIAVRAAIIKESDRSLTRTYTATLRGEMQADVYSRLAEAVDEVLVKQGERVTTDQVIITLDRYGASSQYTQAQSVFLNSEKNYNKMAFLYEKGAVSESEYDAARTDYEVTKATFEAVAKMVEVPTPIAGTVTSMEVSPGDLVTVGQKLATIATTGRLRARFGVNADELPHFAIGSEVNVISDAVQGSLRGKVISIASSADPVTRSFEIEALFDNTTGLFRPGMFVRVEFVRAHLGSVVSIPRKAILNLNDLEVVFVIKAGKAERRTVTLGADLAGDVVITSGLAAGDTLVILGQDYLADGTNVNITTLDK